jgi:hypothetical protein
MEVLDHGIQVEALELLGVIEALAHGIGQLRVLVQDLQIQLIGPPICVRSGSSRCVFQSAARERALRFVGHGSLLWLLATYCTL